MNQLYKNPKKEIAGCERIVTTTQIRSTPRTLDSNLMRFISYIVVQSIAWPLIKLTPSTKNLNSFSPGSVRLCLTVHSNLLQPKEPWPSISTMLWLRTSWDISGSAKPWHFGILNKLLDPTEKRLLLSSYRSSSSNIVLQMVDKPRTNEIECFSVAMSVDWEKFLLDYTGVRSCP